MNLGMRTACVFNVNRFPTNVPAQFSTLHPERVQISARAETRAVREVVKMYPL